MPAFRDTQITPIRNLAAPLVVPVGASFVGIFNTGAADAIFTVTRTAAIGDIRQGVPLTIPQNPQTGGIEEITIDGTGTTLDVIIIR